MEPYLQQASSSSPNVASQADKIESAMAEKDAQTQLKEDRARHESLRLQERDRRIGIQRRHEENSQIQSQMVPILHFRDRVSSRRCNAAFQIAAGGVVATVAILGIYYLIVR